MPFYHKLGEIPPKRHTQFRKKDGTLYYEQLFGTDTFNSYWSEKCAEFEEAYLKTTPYKHTK